MKKLFIFLLVAVISVSCVSTKSTLKNVDNSAPDLILTKDKVFVITEYSKDTKYGYDKDYPINLFYKNTRNETLNQERFLNALAGPNGEKIFYEKLEACCPFPTKNAAGGAGLLDVYEIKWIGQKKPVRLYLNMYEKSVLMVPTGFTLKTF